MTPIRPASPDVGRPWPGAPGAPSGRGVGFAQGSSGPGRPLPPAGLSPRGTGAGRLPTREEMDRKRGWGTEVSPLEAQSSARLEVPKETWENLARTRLPMHGSVYETLADPLSLAMQSPAGPLASKTIMSSFRSLTGEYSSVQQNAELRRSFYKTLDRSPRQAADMLGQRARHMRGEDLPNREWVTLAECVQSLPPSRARTDILIDLLEIASHVRTANTGSLLPTLSLQQTDAMRPALQQMVRQMDLKEYAYYAANTLSSLTTLNGWQMNEAIMHDVSEITGKVCASPNLDEEAAANANRYLFEVNRMQFDQDGLQPSLLTALLKAATTLTMVAPSASTRLEAQRNVDRVMHDAFARLDGASDEQGPYVAMLVTLLEPTPVDDMFISNKKQKFLRKIGDVIASSRSDDEKRNNSYGHAAEDLLINQLLHARNSFSLSSDTRKQRDALDQAISFLSLLTKSKCLPSSGFIGKAIPLVRNMPACEQKTRLLGMMGRIAWDTDAGGTAGDRDATSMLLRDMLEVDHRDIGLLAKSFYEGTDIKSSSLTSKVEKIIIARIKECDSPRIVRNAIDAVCASMASRNQNELGELPKTCLSIIEDFNAGSDPERTQLIEDKICSYGQGHDIDIERTESVLRAKPLATLSPLVVRMVRDNEAVPDWIDQYKRQVSMLHPQERAKVVGSLREHVATQGAAAERMADRAFDLDAELSRRGDRRAPEAGAGARRVLEFLETFPA